MDDFVFVIFAAKLRLNRPIYENQLWKWRKRYCLLLTDGSFIYYEQSPYSPFLNLTGSPFPNDFPKPIGVIIVKDSNVSCKNTNIIFEEKESYEIYKFQCKSKNEALSLYKHFQISQQQTLTPKLARRNSTELLVSGYCSWCLEDVYHGKISSGIVGRDSYSCTSCCKRTTPCLVTNCTDFARGHKFLDDSLCLVHLKTIKSWNVDTGNLRKSSILCQEGWCTWCRQDSTHKFIEKNYIKRDFMRCTNCNHRTVICKNNNCNGMAKATYLYSDKLCGNCRPSNLVELEEEENINTFDSFASEHENINATFLVDGKETFEAMATAIENAKHDIYMAFWLMCCVIRVRKTLPPTDEDRIDKILLKKANEGVNIYIILWDEAVLLNNCSKENKTYLEALSPRIKVIRHPTFRPIIYSHHQKFVVIDQTIAFVGGIDIAWGRYDWSDHFITDINKEHWWGIDYYNPHICPPTEFYDIENPDKDYFDRKLVTRMPWHDVEVMVNGKVAKDVALNFIQRWNHHKDKNEPELVLRKDDIEDNQEGTCVCQVLRSLGNWSGTPNGKTENSIYQAYIKIIENSDFYIYIENQFFVSSYGGTGVSNQIAYAIHMRIKKAITKKHDFTCVIIFPQPEEVGRWAIPTLQRELRTALSLLERLQDDFPNVNISNYIQFYQLRSYGYLNEQPVTDQIFVHSKLIIVDDRVAIVGSNNINDRSFMGDRDSELAILTKDTDEIPITINNNNIYSVGNSIHNLRVRLWNEHMGLDSDSDLLVDPIIGASELQKVAKKNTKVFEKVFGCIPSNRIRKWSVYNKVREENFIHPNHKTHLSKIRGKIMLHPLHFLGDEKITVREGLMAKGLFQ